MSNVNIKTPDWLRQMQSILEELNEGVVIVDDQLRVVFANEALIRMGQYERGEIEGRTPEAIFPATDIPYIMRQHESGHRYGRSRSEFYLPRKNGEKIPAIFSGRIIQAPDGQEYVLLIVPTSAHRSASKSNFANPTPNWKSGRWKLRPNSHSLLVFNNRSHHKTWFGTMSRSRLTTTQRVPLGVTSAWFFHTATMF
jgi:PAS domain S-box-containing protein